MSFTCLILGHKRDGNHVWHDGQDFHAPCVHCGKNMVKGVDGRWRLSAADQTLATPRPGDS